MSKGSKSFQSYYNAIPKDYVKNVMQNGVGRYVCQLKRITFRFCKEHGGSRHAR